jgi:hypothetical protein
MRYYFIVLYACLILLSKQIVLASVTVKPGPSVIPCFDVYEIIVEPDSTPEGNPFTDVQVSACQ